MKIKLIAAGITACLANGANALEACATSTTNGGAENVIVHTDIEVANAKNITDSAYREISSAVQEAVGNSVSHTGVSGVTLTVFGEACAYGVVCVTSTLLAAVPIPYSGNQSFGKAILNHVHVDEEKPDENPCDPALNDGNNASSGGSSGGSGGGGAPGLPGVGGGGVIMPTPPSDPCEKIKCNVIITPE